MSYKTILIHVDDTSGNPARIQIAGEIALRFDAHLSAVADTGVARFVFLDGNISGVDPSLIVNMNQMRDRATKNIKAFKKQVDVMGLRSFDGIVAKEDAWGSVGLRSRYCDLSVVGQTNPAEMSDAIMDDFPEYMVLNSGRPTLIVPYAGEFSNIGQRPIVAWDGSRAAARAVTDALPFLKLAESVSIAMFNSKLSAGEQVGAELVAFLGRHDIQAEVIAKKTKLDIGNALLSLAADCNADMLVMGGYGHSRLREMIMGGVTRRILESMTLPVLMSH